MSSIFRLGHIYHLPSHDTSQSNMGVVSQFELENSLLFKIYIHDHQYKVAFVRNVCNRNLNLREILTLFLQK